MSCHLHDDIDRDEAARVTREFMRIADDYGRLLALSVFMEFSEWQRKTDSPETVVPEKLSSLISRLVQDLGAPEERVANCLDRVILIHQGHSIQ